MMLSFLLLCSDGFMIMAVALKNTIISYEVRSAPAQPLPAHLSPRPAGACSTATRPGSIGPQHEQPTGASSIAPKHTGTLLVLE
jgi:hypothetical protein